MENQYGLPGSTQPVENLPETNWEDIHSKRLMDSASRHVTEGRFEQARLQLEAAQRLCAGTKGISELLAIAEVCIAAVGRSCPCQSRRHKFPDWYHILKVDEKADINIIKKRYRQLALLLHPDKNTHVKAEGAFKFISQAYDCLSDKTKRVTFNLERAKLFCRRCSLSSEARDSIPIVSNTVPRRSRQDRQEFVSPRESNSGVCSATELVWESARLQAFRRKARARAEAAGSELGSRLWRWNKEFEKLNIRRDDTDFERRHIVSRAREHVNEARSDYMWRNKGSRTDRNSHVSTSEFRTDDTRQVHMTIPGDGSLKQSERPRVSQSLDDLLKSLKSTSERAQFSQNTARKQSTYPSFETGYFGSGYRQNLPSPAAIIKYFKDLSASSPQPELTDEPKKLSTSSSLKEVYFPSKKGVDSSSIQKSQEQSSSKSQPVVPSKTQRGNVLPEKDLSRLDSASLLKNLDAALADISRSAGKSDYFLPPDPPSKKDRQSFEIDSPVKSSSILSKLSAREKPPKKPLSLGRAVKVENNDDLSSSASEKHSHSLRAGQHCSGQPISFTSSSECLAENPSMYITPLLRKQGERSMASDIGSSVLETQSKGSFDSHLADRGSFVSKSHFPVWSSGAALSEAGGCEMTCQTNSNEMLGSSHTMNSDEFSSSLRCKFGTQSGLNPLLSSERLGKWMDNLAGSSNLSFRESQQEDGKAYSLGTSSSGLKKFSTPNTKTQNWWESKDHIPSYLSVKPVGPLLPDYGRIWKQGDDYSDPPKQTPNVTASSTKSDFSCSPAISLASSTRIPSSDFSCSPAISLAASTRIPSSDFSCSPAISLTASTRIPSSDFSCSPANSLSYSTQLTGSEVPSRLSGLRLLQIGRFDMIGNYPATNKLDSTGSEISQRLNLTQMSSSALNARKAFVHTSNDYAKLSTDFPWLSPRRSRKSDTGLDSYRTELGPHAEKGDDFHELYKMDQNLENHRQKSDELVATLERLREEAKSIAITLQNYNDSSRIQATTVLQGVYSSSTNGLLPKCQSAPACLTA